MNHSIEIFFWGGAAIFRPKKMLVPAMTFFGLAGGGGKILQVELKHNRCGKNLSGGHK